jgi:hypothetical protein
MLILPSIKVRRNDRSGRPRAWNDPERALYPHHAEFWPELLPEHVLLERRHRKRKRRLRQLLLRRFLRKALGIAGLSAIGRSAPVAKTVTLSRRSPPASVARPGARSFPESLEKATVTGPGST